MTQAQDTPQINNCGKWLRQNQNRALNKRHGCKTKKPNRNTNANVNADADADAAMLRGLPPYVKAQRRFREPPYVHEA